MEVIDDYIAKLTNDGVINPHMTDDVSLDSVLATERSRKSTSIR